MKHPIILIIVHFAVSGIILGIIYLIYFLSIFNLAGGETLQEIENQRNILLGITITIVILTYFICRHFLRIGNKYKAIGISIFPIVSFILVSIYFVNNIHYKTVFHKSTWNQSTKKPFGMAVTLIKESKLTGMTEQEIFGLLGHGDERHWNEQEGKGSIWYRVEKDWTLIVYIEKDKVIEAILRRPTMMT